MRLIDADALMEEFRGENGADALGHSPLRFFKVKQIVNDSLTIDAIPVEWLDKRRQNLILAAMVHSTVYGDNSIELCHAVNVVLDMWQKEQEAQDG